MAAFCSLYSLILTKFFLHGQNRWKSIRWAHQWPTWMYTRTCTHYPYRSDTVGWSDFQFFAIFENDCWRLAIFLKVQFQKIGARTAKFFSSKNHIDLKKYFLVNIFLLLQKRIAKRKIWETFFIYFILGPQNGQKLGQRKNDFLEFLSIFSF